MVTGRSHSASGFSVVELVVVLFIMATMAAIALPRISSSINRYRADLLARRITDDLAHAQSHARMASASHDFAFDPGRNRYVCENLPSLRNPAGYLIVELSDEPFYGELVSADFSGDQTLRISGHGLPNRTGSITIRVGEEKRLITIDAEGAITTSRVVNSTSSAESKSVSLTLP